MVFGVVANGGRQLCSKTTMFKNTDFEKYRSRKRSVVMTHEITRENIAMHLANSSPYRERSATHLVRTTHCLAMDDIDTSGHYGVPHHRLDTACQFDTPDNLLAGCWIAHRG